MRLLSLLAFAALSFSSYADVLVENAYARASPPGAINSAAFMTIHNDGAEAIKLVSASSSAADVVELHNHEHHMGVMRMRQVDAIDVAGHGTTELKPGGLHVMLLGLRESLREGMHIKVPFRDNIKRFEVRTRPTLLSCDTGTKDMQIVHITMRVLFRPVESELSTIMLKLGMDYDTRVVPSIA